VHNSTNHSSRAHLRRCMRNTIRALALTGALLVLTATTAAAMPNRADGGVPAPTQTTVRVIAPTSGFDWADAGIGAAAGLAISLIAIGGALALTRRHDRHDRHDRAVRPTVSATRCSSSQSATANQRRAGLPSSPAWCPQPRQGQSHRQHGEAATNRGAHATTDPAHGAHRPPDHRVGPAPREEESRASQSSSPG
jgi:hypothetical protein